MHKSVIVFKAKGQTIPLDFATRLLKEYPSWNGVALMHGDKLVAQSSKDALSPEKLVKTSEKFKDRGMLMGFGNYDAGFRDEDIQPFTVLKDDKDASQIVAFMCGQYPGFVLAGKNESPESRFADISLTAKIAELHELSDKQLPKTLNMLQKPLIQNTITQSAVGDSVVVLMAKKGKDVGEVLIYPKDHTSKPTESEWGWFTDARLEHEQEQEEAPQPDVDEEEPPQPDTDDEEAPEPDIFGDEEERGPPIKNLPAPKPKQAPATAGKGNKAPVIASTEPFKPPTTMTAIQVKPPEGKNIEVQKDTRGVVTLESDGFFYYDPNKGLHGKVLKESFRTVAGFLPNGKPGTDQHYANQPKVRVTDEKAVIYQQKLTALSPKVAEAAVTAAVKEAAKDTPKKISLDRPALSGKEIESVQKKLKDPKVKGTIDDHANDIVNPTILASYEQKFPEAAVLAKYEGGTNGTLRWSFDTFKELCQNHPGWAANLMMDYRYLYLKTLADHDVNEFNKVMAPTQKKQDKNLPEPAKKAG